MTNCEETSCFSLQFGSATQPKAYIRQFLCLLCLLFFGFLPSAKAQSSVEYSVYANIIYHFTKYVDWPDDIKAEEFIIGVVGDTPLFDELQKTMTHKVAGKRRIIVRRYSPTQESYNCQILFLSESQTSSLVKISQRTSNDPVLLICEDRGAASRGACINFAVVAERLKLEINKENIERRRLRIANELLRLGTLVK
jgi:hypothetical protein